MRCSSGNNSSRCYRCRDMRHHRLVVTLLVAVVVATVVTAFSASTISIDRSISSARSSPLHRRHQYINTDRNRNRNRNANHHHHHFYNPHHHYKNQPLSSFSLLSAKPSPKTAFDLDAIEAFETQLDLLAATAASAPTKAVVEEETNDSNDEGGGRNSKKDIVSSAANDAATEDTKFIISSTLDGKRLDAVLVLLFREQQQQQQQQQRHVLTRSQCGSLIKHRTVFVNEVVVERKSYKVRTEDVVSVRANTITNPLPIDRIVPENIPLDIIYEDAEMIVLNKAAGMVVHPAAGNWNGTVVNALAYYLSKVSTKGCGNLVVQSSSSSSSAPSASKLLANHNTEEKKKEEEEDDDEYSSSLSSTSSSLLLLRPGIVHRLDKGTTGCLVVAKTRRAHTALSAAFAQRTVHKMYTAITIGNPTSEGTTIVINKPIGRHPMHRQKMRVVPNPNARNSKYKRLGMGRVPGLSTSSTGKSALSYVDTIATSDNNKLTLIQVRIETGRTHQIRVHLQDHNTPVYGDDIYGLTDWNRKLQKKYAISRPLLHAQRLELTHPITGTRMVFTAGMAEDMIRTAATIWPELPHERPDLLRSSATVLPQSN